jgi:hypothetical protein
MRKFIKPYIPFFETQNDIKIGSIIKFGKWKNKTATVTGFGVDKNNQPTIITDKGEMSLYHVRIDKLISENFNQSDYLKWKKNNVTYRGIKSLGKVNEVFGSFGKGLYTVPLSNKSMAKTYGDLYFVVGAIPKKPEITYSLNDAEIWRQNIVNTFCKKHNEPYSLSFFEKHTSIEKEVMKMGFDGLIIKGREMVNYKPSDDIKYFRTENELINYYENSVLRESVLEEDLHLSDFAKHTGVSDFTKRFMIDRRKLRGAGNINEKIKSLKINRKQDYITFVFKTAPTYKKKTQDVDPNTFTLKNASLYEQQIQIVDFFKYAETKPGFIEKEMTWKEIKEVLEVCPIKIWCSCGSFEMQGINAVVTSFDAAIYPELRWPKRWNRVHNDDSFVCKHLDLLFSAIDLFKSNMTSMINSYIKKH